MAKGLFNLNPRKSIKIGGVKLNLSKSGVGASVGIKGLRVGVSSKGKSYVSAGKGIFRQTKYLGSTKTQKIMSNTSSETAKAEPWSNKHLMTVLITFFFGWCGLHRFYLGHKYLGIAYILLFWTTLPFFISMGEFIYFTIISEKNFQKKYLK